MRKSINCTSETSNEIVLTKGKASPSESLFWVMKQISELILSIGTKNYKILADTDLEMFERSWIQHWGWFMLKKIHLVFKWKHSGRRTKRGRMGTSPFFIMNNTKGPGGGGWQLEYGTLCTNVTRRPCCKRRDFSALKWLQAPLRGVLLLKT